MSTVFRDSTPTVETPDVEQAKADSSAKAEIEGYRPIEEDQDILEALGVEDDIKVLPKDDFDDFQELKGYLESYMAEKGLPNTYKGVQKALQNIKKDTGLDEEADPQAVIKKVGGIARSWKEISFIRDFEDRKKVLVKLLGASSQTEMDRIVLDEMGARKVWQ
jgi:hypothetical protein